jgi:hypothetical protein
MYDAIRASQAKVVLSGKRRLIQKMAFVVPHAIRGDFPKRRRMPADRAGDRVRRSDSGFLKAESGMRNAETGKRRWMSTASARLS